MHRTPQTLNASARTLLQKEVLEAMLQLPDLMEVVGVLAQDTVLSVPGPHRYVK